MRGGKTQRQSVTDAERLSYSTSSPAAEVSTMQIGHLEAAEFLSDKESDKDYVLVSHEPGTPLNILVSAAQANKKTTQQLSLPKDIKHRIMKWADQEKTYAMPKNKRYGDWKPVSENPNTTTKIRPPTVNDPTVHLSSQASDRPESMIIEYDNPDDGSSSFPIIIKINPKEPRIIKRGDPALKPVVKEKPRKLAKVLKGSYKRNTLTKRLLNQKIEVTIQELLTTTPEIERVLTKALSEGEVAEFQVASLANVEGITEDLDSVTYPILPQDTSWYAMRCATAKVSLDRQFKMSALLDSGSQINVMDRQTMIDAGLAMRPGPRIRLISHNRSLIAFAGVCKNVEVDIGGLVTIYPIFVVETALHALVLGQFFLIKTQFRQSFEDDDVFGTVSDEIETVSVIFRTLAISKAGYRDRSDLFPLN